MASRCKKFEPNIYNKSKCKACFKSKDQHSSEALESSKTARKISKCGYLFVAPDTFDFTNPMDRTRRWQRRFFILYDDGELTYSVDENFGTVPQGTIDMNRCTEVHDAEGFTSHAHSILVSTPDTTNYIKGTSKDEITRWYDVLVMYPRSIKTKHRRSPTYPSATKPPDTKPPNTQINIVVFLTPDDKGVAAYPRNSNRYSTSAIKPQTTATSRDISLADSTRSRRHTFQPTVRSWEKDKENVQPSPVDSGVNLSIDEVNMSRSRSEQTVHETTLSTAAPLTYRGVRSLKHNKNDRNHQEGMRKSSSMHDLSTSPPEDPPTEVLFRSRSRENLSDSFPRRRSSESGSTTPRSSSEPGRDVGSANSSRGQSPANRSRGEDLYHTPHTPSASGSFLYNGRNKNETDEHKDLTETLETSLIDMCGVLMAKSGELAARLNQQFTESPTKRYETLLDDVTYMKKGWLLKQDETTKEWSKHWFVLSGTSLKYYKDSQAEDANQLNGMIEIHSCYEVTELESNRNYGFLLKTGGGDHILSAVTCGIRRNWMQAIQKCMEMHLSRSAERRSSPSPSPSRYSSLSATKTYSSIQAESLPKAASSTRDRSNSQYPSEFKPRKLDLDQVSDSSQGRRRSRQDSREESPRVSKYSSCTWPYDSPSETNGVDSAASSGSERPSTPATPRSRSASAEHRNSDIASYLEEDDVRRPLSQAEDDELDYVERNIRRIHRKSLTEYVQRHRPPHFDKFEEVGRSLTDSGRRSSSTPGRVSGMISPAASSSSSLYSPRDEKNSTRSSPHRSRTTSPMTPIRRSESEHSKLPSATSYKAPSAKIKDKSRAKSPRAKSPPPDADDTGTYLDYLDGRRNSEPVVSAASSIEDITKEIIERKWREQPLSPKESTRVYGGQVEHFGRTRKRSGDTSVAASSISTNDTAVVDLLETEVESLKAQLDRSHVELESLRHSNLDLKAQLRGIRRDHRDSLDDMETDQSRYLNQIGELQDEMEHATGYLKSKLADQANRSELTRIQVQTLKRQARDSKTQVASHQAELAQMKSELEASSNKVSSLEKALEESQRAAKAEKSQQIDFENDWQRKVDELEATIACLEEELDHKDAQIIEGTDSLQKLQEELERRNNDLKQLQRDSEEATSMRREVKEKSERMVELNQEIGMLRQTLNEREGEIASMEEVRNRRTHDMEAEYIQEKQHLSEQIADLETQLEAATKQSNMADSLNTNMADILREKDETIAQLEEKLIENDNKIEELKEELRLDADVNKGLQLNLEHAYDESARVNRDLEEAKKELASEIVSCREEIQLLQTVEQERTSEINQVNRSLKQEQQINRQLKEDNARLKSRLEQAQVAKEAAQNVVQERKTMQQQISTIQGEKEKLEERCQQLAEQLEEAEENIKQLELKLEEDGEAFENDMEEKYRQILETRNLVDSLQTQLDSAEAASRDNVNMLDQTIRSSSPFAEVAANFSVDSVINNVVDSKLQEEYDGLYAKYEHTQQDLKKLRMDIQGAHNTITDHEIVTTGLRQQMKAMEDDYQDQLDLMSNRVQDLTTKLSAAERKVRKLERRRSRSKSKEKIESLSSQDDIEDKMEVVETAPLQASPQASPRRELNMDLSPSKSEDISDSDLSSMSDPELLQKIRQLHDELLLSEEHVKELKQRLSQQVETGNRVTSDADKLREQNQNQAQTITQLTKKLKEMVSEDRVDASGDAPPKSEVQSDLKDKLRIFAERLSLEAMVVGEMAFLVKTGQDKMMSEREVYLHEIEDANSHILGLQQKVDSLYQANVSQEELLQQKEHNSLNMYSSMLADKLILQGQVALLAEKEVTDRQAQTEPITSSGDASAKALAAEALFRSRTDAKLYLPGNANESSLTGVGSKALIESELAFVLKKLKDRMSSCMTDKERIDLLEQELELAQQRLNERENTMKDAVELYKLEKLGDLAANLAKETCYESMAEADQRLGHRSDDDSEGMSRERLESQLVNLVKKYAAEYARDWISPDSEHNEILGKRGIHIDTALQHEVDQLLKLFNQKYEEELERFSNNQGKPQSPVEQSNSERMDSIRKFAEVLAQKSVISGQVRYIQEQLQLQQTSSQRTSGAAYQQLRRQDSGIIIQSSSLPTSPGEYDHGVDSRESKQLVQGLAKEANSRRELSNYLNKYVETSHASEEVQSLIAKIAADIVNLDVSLLKQRKSIHDYAEIITREAIFQAQMTFMVQKLKCEHSLSLKAVQDKLHQTSHGAKHIQKLENEVERLSSLLSENESIFQEETGEAQEQLEKMKQILQAKESDFRAQLKEAEQRHTQELELMEQELEDAREAGERHYKERMEEVAKYEHKINTLERRIAETRAALEDATASQEADTAQYSEKVTELEEELLETRKMLEKTERERDDEALFYKAKVADLESEVERLAAGHQLELAQTQEDMKAALKGVGSAEVAKLEAEVKRLREKLDEERSRHVDELENLRGELSIEANDAAAALLNSKVHQLEHQVQHLTADYEQELVVLKNAHRREMARSKDDLLSLLAAAEVQSVQLDQDSIRKKYMKEIDRIKTYLQEMYDRGFSAMEKSHQRVIIEMRGSHKRELELLRQEKDVLLTEETKATQAVRTAIEDCFDALDAMRKAHEAELQKERNKFLDVIAKTYSHHDVESLQRQHEEDLELIQSEIKALSESYSLKCLENAELEERLEAQSKALQTCRVRITELMSRNEELNLQLKHEVERLNKLVKEEPDAGMSPLRKNKEPQDMYNLRVSLKVKDMEVKTLANEVDTLKDQLHTITQELEDQMEKYAELYTEHEESHRAYNCQIHDLKRRLSALQEEDEDEARSTTSDKSQEENGSAQSVRIRRRSRSPLDPQNMSPPQHQSSSPESSRSPSPKRESSQSPTSSSDRTSRQLPSVPTDTRTAKRQLWRQRQPQRAHSSPGLTTPGDLELPDPPTDAELNTPEETSEKRSRSQRHTTVGINVANQQLQEKF